MTVSYSVINELQKRQSPEEAGIDKKLCNDG